MPHSPALVRGGAVDPVTQPLLRLFAMSLALPMSQSVRAMRRTSATPSPCVSFGYTMPGAAVTKIPPLRQPIPLSQCKLSAQIRAVSKTPSASSSSQSGTLPASQPPGGGSNGKPRIWLRKACRSRRRRSRSDASRSVPKPPSGDENPRRAGTTAAQRPGPAPCADRYRPRPATCRGRRRTTGSRPPRPRTGPSAS